MSTSPPSPRSPVLRTQRRQPGRSDFYLQARSLSELALHNLSVADMWETRHSQLNDEDLLDSLAPLGTGVVEEAEEMFRDRCTQALEYAATPSRSPTAPAPSVASSPPRSSCSSASRPRVMADYADPSYFALGRQALYSDGGESSYSSGISTPSLWYQSEAGSSYADSGVGSPLPATPANEQEKPATYSCAGSPSLLASRLADARGASTIASSLDLDAAAEMDDGGPPAPTIAARRSGLSLKLDLSSKTLPTSASLATLRDRGGPAALVSRATKSPAAEPALSPLSAPSSPRIASAVSALSRLAVTDAEANAAAASIAAEAGSTSDAVDDSTPATSKPTWLQSLEQRVAPTDGIKLKRKPTHAYAF
ncbi:hypothetical protein BMF94_6755 [Rhodotorula taiwanensis]|uniref:Uncharacterized protein n=1 Tax=Rhodotorula taiwanensis TaxID=741276 RepID=A0A2S5B059_9BASI|nr:hypothetical protein BMF94_6755 [Rhodotorula taiwanensis]